VTSQDDRVPRRAQDVGRAAQLARRRFVGTRPVDDERPGAGRRGGGLDVLGNREVHGARTLGLSQLERLADHLRHCLGGRDQLGPFGHGREHRHEIDALVRLLELSVHADLC
jgi:hypothetical protein